MANADTVKLLKECDAGIKMGISSIEEVMDSVQDDEFKSLLEKSLDEHSSLERKTEESLARMGDEGKDPKLMAKGMAWMKTNAMLAMEASDATVADLLTDGCHMGIKSINRYMNQYKNAEDIATDTAKEIIKIEENLAQDMRKYL